MTSVGLASPKLHPEYLIVQELKKKKKRAGSWQIIRRGFWR